MSKTPRGSSTSTIPQRNKWRDHQHAVAEFIKDRDANPLVVNTVFGTWRSGKGGTSETTFTAPLPVPVRSKRKYRPGN
jgi:hypothetical protein